jgi:zinc protease
MNLPIERFTLPNGLRVVLSRDSALPAVAVNLWYAVGSRNERPGRTGLAHLFEHMMFQGSRNVAPAAHIALVQRAGGTVNASTWLDRTNYFQVLPSSRLELALWLESDRMGSFLEALTAETFENQREVVKNERRQRVDNAPYGDWDERLQRMVYPAGHPYHHPVIGSMEDLEAITLDDVSAFFRTYYAPNNAVLTICGDLRVDTARALVERWFGPLPAGPPIPPLGPRAALDPLPLGAEVRERVEADVGLARVHLAWRIPPYGTPGFYPADVLSEVLAGRKSSLLYRGLVRERRLARGVGAFAFPLVTGAAMLILRADVAEGGDPVEVEEAMLEEIAGVSRTGPAPADLERAMTGIEARRTMELQRLAERADRISMFTCLFDDPGLVNTEIDRYRSVEAASLAEVADRFLGPARRAALTYVPRAEDAA